MISDHTVDRALTRFLEELSFEGRTKAMRAALESAEGSIQQSFANDQVKQGRDQGSCPTCGAEM
jgi:hypothetical protein